MKRESGLLLVIRLILGGLLLWAGLAKLGDPSRFFGALLGYSLPLPESLLRFIAVTLPCLECLCGVALISNLWAETVRPLVALLCLTFVVLLSQALLRNLAIDCGCFGGASDAWYNQPLVAWARATALLLAALLLTLRRRI